MSYASFFHGISHPAAKVSQDGRILEANVALRELIASEELAEQPCLQLFHRDDRPVIRSLLDNAAFSAGCVMARLHNGHNLNWRAWAPDGPDIIWLSGTGSDDCDADRRLQRLVESETRLEDFSRIVAHDLKAPIRGARQLAAWLREDLGDDLPPAAGRHLDLLEDRVQKMDTLLLGLSRFTRSTQEIQEPTLVDINGLVLECLGGAEGIKLSTTDLPTIETPKAPLHHVFANLLNNAKNHSDRDVPEIEVVARELTEGWEFSVTDNGPGIPERLRERVFTMFLSLNQNRPGGDGIGLSIVQRIIERVGGSLQCESPVLDDRGTRMTFLWPKYWRGRR